MFKKYKQNKRQFLEVKAQELKDSEEENEDYF
jgi:hypothetical protein